jgi:hypothetical protein
MAKFDVMDEAIIDAPPNIVYKAFLNEFAGSTHMFVPYYEFKLRGDIPIDHEGAIVDLAVHNGKLTSNLTAKITEMVESKSIKMEYEGDFIATEDYAFEPAEDKTKVTLRFKGRTNRLLFSFLSPFVNFGKGHSEMVHKSFNALNSQLNKK